MDATFWRERWSANRIGFHEGVVNRQLLRFADEALPAPGGGRVLVPLCGKAEDLAFLAGRGHEVFGCDLAPEAAEAFFAEHGAPEVERTTKGALTWMRVGAITIAVGDFFALDPADAGTFDAVYDRAALIALPAEMREAYVVKVRSLVREGGGGRRGLVVTLEHDLPGGPPFTVGPEEVARTYGARFGVTERARDDITSVEQSLTGRGATRVVEVAWAVG